MIVLDTNVISEMMRPAGQRSSAVFDWLSRQSGERLFTSTITAAELLSGVAIMPTGNRKAEKANAVQSVLALFRGRILPFDLASARHYAEAVTLRRKSGRAIDAFDLLIAAIARSNNMAVATRNTIDFEGCGIDLINPWDA